MTGLPPQFRLLVNTLRVSTMEKYQFKSGFSLTNACMFAIFIVKLLKYSNSYHWKHF